MRANRALSILMLCGDLCFFCWSAALGYTAATNQYSDNWS